jgi:hypothetical protein
MSKTYNFNLVNPKIDGTAQTTFKASSPSDAAKDIYESLSKNFANNVPRFFFSIEKEKNGKFYHFDVNEKINGHGEVRYELNQIKSITTEQENGLRQFIKDENTKRESRSNEMRGGGEEKAPIVPEESEFPVTEAKPETKHEAKPEDSEFPVTEAKPEDSEFPVTEVKPEAKAKALVGGKSRRKHRYSESSSSSSSSSSDDEDSYYYYKPRRHRQPLTYWSVFPYSFPLETELVIPTFLPSSQPYIFVTIDRTLNSSGN